jgi:hypothetical protein
MSLLLNGSKTVTIAGTEMQCVEIYTGESYTLPLAFVDSTGNAINCTLPNNWGLSTSAKFYEATDITYGIGNDIVLGNLTLASPQPSTGAGTYSANLVAAFSNASAGLGYLYIPSNLTGGTGSPNPTPTILPSAVNTSAPSTVVVVTLTVSRQSTANASLADVNKEPIGMIVRYQ